MASLQFGHEAEWPRCSPSTTTPALQALCIIHILHAHKEIGVVFLRGNKCPCSRGRLRQRSWVPNDITVRRVVIL